MKGNGLSLVTTRTVALKTYVSKSFHLSGKFCLKGLMEILLPNQKAGMLCKCLSDSVYNITVNTAL